MLLSLFPGVGLLDHAFELEGFTVVRGPDALWGGDVGKFHPAPDVFEGIIGGPPCQAHVRYAKLNKSIGKRVAPDLIPEFLRVIIEARPVWFLMENSDRVYDVNVPGYVVQRFKLDAALFGLDQERKRKFQFGHIEGKKIRPEIHPVVSQRLESAVLASEGRSGVIHNRRGAAGNQESYYKPRRSFARVLELQGLPKNFLEDAPFTIEGKYKVVGNGVPLPMGRALAKAIRQI